MKQHRKRQKTSSLHSFNTYSWVIFATHEHLQCKRTIRYHVYWCVCRSWELKYTFIEYTSTNSNKNWKKKNRNCYYNTHNKLLLWVVASWHAPSHWKCHCAIICHYIIIIIIAIFTPVWCCSGWRVLCFYIQYICCCGCMERKNVFTRIQQTA